MSAPPRTAFAKAFALAFLSHVAVPFHVPESPVRSSYDMIALTAQILPINQDAPTVDLLCMPNRFCFVNTGQPCTDGGVPSRLDIVLHRDKTLMQGDVGQGEQRLTWGAPRGSW